MASFQEGRSQVVRIGSATSPSLKLNGGISQGARLGPILFVVMSSDFLQYRLPRAKYMDDLTAIEIIPRNTPSVLPSIVLQLQSFASSSNMCLNPVKCKVLAVDVLHYNSFQCPPIALGSTFLEVKSFKFLGVLISHDLTWEAQCNFTVKKANRHHYAIRQLKTLWHPCSGHC